MKKLFALMLCASLVGCATAPTATTTESVAPASLTETQAAPAADTAAVPAPESAVAPEAAAAVAAPAAEAAPTAGQVVGDIAAQCTKKYAALKLCDRAGLGAGICRKTVEKKYSSLACALVR